MFSNNQHSSLFCAGVIDDEQKRFWFQPEAIQKLQIRDPRLDQVLLL
jgi:hypothetical protein